MAMPRRPKIEIPPMNLQPPTPRARATFLDYARAVGVILGTVLASCVAIGVGLRLIVFIAGF